MRNSNREKRNSTNAFETSAELLLDALNVPRFRRIHFYSVAGVHERRHLNHQARFESGRLHHRAGRGFLQRRFCFHHL